MAIVPLVHTSPGTPAAWLRDRAGVLLAALDRRGIPWPVAKRAALAVLAHWANETGWGRGEWNYSLGNVRARGTPVPAGQLGWHGDAMLLRGGDDARPAPYKAYESAADGVEDYLRLLETRCRGPLAYLLTTGDAAGWYQQMGEAGYFTWGSLSADQRAAALQNYSSIVRGLAPQGV